MIKTVFIVIAFCALFQLTVQRSEVLPHKVIEYMGSRAMRYHHFLWHNLRENWLNLDASTQHAISKLGWTPPRPAVAYSANGTNIVLEDNGSGEDFLYMHRQMVIEVNKMVADTDYEKIVGWTNCPYPKDPKWPVPANYSTGLDFMDVLITEAKSDEYFWNFIQPWDEKLHDPEYLRTISLGKLGAQVEFTVHQKMHLRFSDAGTVGLRNPFTDNPTPDVDAKWDNLDYQWLGDTYSSHVNPIFWKIHGWVDDCIEAWRVANGYAEVPWQNTWEEGPEATISDLFAAGDVKDDSDDTDPDTDDSDMVPDEEMLTAMAKVVKIMLDLGKSGHMISNATVSGP